MIDIYTNSYIFDDNDDIIYNNDVVGHDTTGGFVLGLVILMVDWDW